MALLTPLASLVARTLRRGRRRCGHRCRAKPDQIHADFTSAENLDKADILSLRTTCRTLARDTDDAFMRLFASRCLSLSTSSLTHFRGLSRVPRFARAVQVIKIVCPEPWVEIQITHDEGVSDVKLLRRFEDVQLLLSESFKNLARLKAGRRIQLVSPGVLDHYGNNIVYEALAESGHRVESLIAEAANMNLTWCHGMISQSFSPAEDLSPAHMIALQAPWSTLQTLDLGFRHDDWEADMRMYRILSCLLAGATQLQELSLRECSSNVLWRVHTCLAATRLRLLSLRDIDTEQDALCRLLPTTLQELHLENVRLTSDVDEDTWAEVLRWMPEHLTLSKLYAKDLQVMILDDNEWLPRFETLLFERDCTELLVDGSKEEVDAKLSEAAGQARLEATSASSEQ